MLSFSAMYIQNKWFIDEHAKLVCTDNSGGEVRYIIFEMRRTARKKIKGTRGDYWTFNNNRIIVDEAMFDWGYAGLRSNFQRKSPECQRNKEEATSNQFNRLHLVL